MAVENFGETPEEFNLDEWIEQGSRPHRTVKVYRDWSLMGDLVDLEQKIAAADAVVDPSPGDVGAEELREQYGKILERLAESALEIQVRALTREEILAITASVPDKLHKFRDSKGEEQERWQPDRIAIGDALAAEATVAPKLTRDQVTKMRQRLGDGPMQALFTAVDELTVAGKALPEVPFSPGSSDGSRE